MVTLKKLRIWYRLINDSLYDGELPEPEIVLINNSPVFDFPIDGVAIDSGGGHYWIGIDKALSAREAFATLVHETIHVWQFEGGKSGGHGRDFVRECARAMEVFNYE